MEGYYTRERALRLLNIPAGRLRYWERRGLVGFRPNYSLGELSELRRLSRLTAQGLKLSGLLLEVFRQRWIGCSQRRAVVRDERGLMELETGQGVLDFGPPPGVQDLREREEDGVELLKAGRAREAVDRFELDLKKEPWSVVVRFNLALALEQLDRLSEADQQLERALALCPGHADCHYNRARLLELQGRTGEARGHWLSYLRLEPDSEEAEGVRRFLSEQRGLHLVPCP